MPKSLENPFLPSHGVKPDLSALAEQGFLPPDEVAKLRELEDQKDRSSKFDVRNSLSGVSLKEGMSVVEKRRVELLKTRQRLIAWAAEYDLGKAEGMDVEEWVMANFDFQEDGSAICLGSLDLEYLNKPDIPEGIIEVTDELLLDSLETAEGLVLPKKIYLLYMNSLISAKGLKMPENLVCLEMNALLNADGLNIPNTVTSLSLNGLKSVEKLQLPDSLEELYLNSITTTEGLVFPNSIKLLNLQSVRSVSGVTFPEKLKILHLESVTSVEGIVLPNELRSLHLNRVRSLNGLVIPETMANLYVNSITTIEGLNLPKGTTANIYCEDLDYAEKQLLRSKYPGATIK